MGRAKFWAVAQAAFWLAAAVLGGGSFAANLVPGSIALNFQTVTTRAAVGGGFTPDDMAQPGDGSLYFADITGRVIKHDGISPSVFLNLTTNPNVSFTTSFAGGLLGIAFHPGYNNSESLGYR